MALQLDRSRRGVSVEPFGPLPPPESQLLKRHGAEWFGERFARSVTAHVERGFPRMAELNSALEDLAALAEEDGLRTVVSVAFGGRARLPFASRDVVPFLWSPALRHLRELRRLAPAELEALPSAPFSLDRVDLCGLPDSDVDLTRLLRGVTTLSVPWDREGMPQLGGLPVSRLELHRDAQGPLDAVAPWLLKLRPSLRAVVLQAAHGRLHLVRGADDAWFAPLDHARISVHLLDAVPSVSRAQGLADGAFYLAEGSEIDDVALDALPEGRLELLDLRRAPERRLPRWPELTVSFFPRLRYETLRWAVEQPVRRLRIRQWGRPGSELVMTRGTADRWSAPEAYGPMTFELARAEPLLAQLGLRRAR